jgi:hypothetical protein
MIHPQQVTKKRTISSVITTTLVDLYTTPQQYEAEVASILFGNSTGGAVTVTLRHYDAVAATSYIVLGSYSVGAYGVFQLENALWLAKSDKIQVSSGTGNAMTITMVVKELYSPQQF